MSAEKKYRWNRASFVLHALVGLAVIFQLSMILLHESFKGTGLSHTVISAHKYVGIAAFFILVIYVFGKLGGRFGGWRGAFPWLSQQGRRAIGADLKSLVKLRLPVRTCGGGLAGLVQGLGLLLILAMASTGFVSYILWNYLDLTDAAGYVFSWHRNLGVLVWWFVGGHVGMALIHRITPERYWTVTAE